MVQSGMSIHQALYPCSRVHRICIVVAFSIYVAAGREIFRKRKQLRAFQGYPPAVEEATIQVPGERHRSNNVHISREVTVSGEPVPSPNWLPQVPRSQVVKPQRGYEQYSVSIERGSIRASTGQHQLRPGTAISRVHHNHTAALAANKAAWGYTKCAILFFVSLTITWVCAIPHFLSLPPSLLAPKPNIYRRLRHRHLSTVPTLLPTPKSPGRSPSPQVWSYP